MVWANCDLSVAMHNALISSIDGLVLPRAPSPEVDQNWNVQLVNLSEAFRDMRMEITISRLRQEDIFHLRNIMQAIIRALMAVDPVTSLFDSPASPSANSSANGDQSEDVTIDIETPGLADRDSFLDPASDGPSAYNFVKDILAGPTRDLIDNMTRTLAACDVKLMDIAGHSHLSCNPNIYSDEPLEIVHGLLKVAMAMFDQADSSLIDHPVLPYSKYPELVQIFLFVHPLRQAADSVNLLAQKALEIDALPNARSLKIYPPNYPWKKAKYRTNPQVHHDRGGLTAVYYFECKKEIDELMNKSAGLAPIALPGGLGGRAEEKPAGESLSIMPVTNSVRYRIWRVMHRLQEFESRFAVKMGLITVLLSLPAWLEGSKGWYYENSGWWAVIAAWLMMHPRVSTI